LARVAGWALLVAVTAIVTTVLHALAVPAALLLGPLVAAIGVAAIRPGLAMPHWTVTVGQAAVGCVIAGAMAGGIGPGVAARWPLFAGIAAVTILLSGGIGYALARMRVVPGTVAVWGSMPGGAAAMVLMAEADGADARLVAVMVYTRVLVVTMSATALAALLGADPTTAARVVPATSLLPTLCVAVGGAALATVIRWPAGTLIVTMGSGLAVEALGWGRLAMPMPATVAAFALIGWRIGLSFTRDARGAALRMLPRVALASIALVALCGGIALILHVMFGIDPLTAWLATSPGGLESVAIIATSLPVDAPFIMAAQTARFAAVMLIGPAVATFLARRAWQGTGAAMR
jgi:membrane AbrB-like protein